LPWRICAASVGFPEIRAGSKLGRNDSESPRQCANERTCCWPQRVRYYQSSWKSIYVLYTYNIPMQQNQKPLNEINNRTSV
jgi:hypothetical protein